MDYRKFLEKSRQAADNFDYDKYLSDKEAGRLPRVEQAAEAEEPREGLMRRQTTAPTPSPEQAQYELGGVAERFIRLRKQREASSGGGGLLGGIIEAVSGKLSGDEGEGLGDLLGGDKGDGNPLAGAIDKALVEAHGITKGGFMSKPSSMDTSGMSDAARIHAKLVERGMPDHVATAFVENFKDESGLSSTINERAPIVKGSRGGFGLYQLTGPRRRDYEAFAAKNNVPMDDWEAQEDAQLDWLMHELETTEKAAARHIFGAETAADAAVAIVNKFLRPAREHRIRRANRYRKL